MEINWYIYISISLYIIKKVIMSDKCLDEKEEVLHEPLLAILLRK